MHTTYEQPLGKDDATIQLVYVSADDNEPLTMLLTVRAKDQDLTEPQIRELGFACLRIADEMKRDQRDRGR